MEKKMYVIVLAGKSGLKILVPATSPEEAVALANYEHLHVFHAKGELDIVDCHEA